jgi:hypothetical protein
MSNHHHAGGLRVGRSHLAGAALSLCFAGALAICEAACGGSHAAAPAPQTAAAPAATQPPAAGGQASSASGAHAHTQAGQGQGQSEGQAGDDDSDSAELVVSRDVVSRCPKLRMVRQHVSEFDPDMVWLAVLESLGECMGQGGPLADQNIGVSGDEEHRHVVREVLGTRGVAPTRVVATPTSVQGAAECQGGGDCSKRVEITLAPGP